MSLPDPPNFTIEDVLRELGVNKDDLTNGVTVEDIVLRCSRSPNWVRQRIARAIRDGRMIFAGTRPIRGIDGRTYHRPVYKLTEKEAK